MIRFALVLVAGGLILLGCSKGAPPSRTPSGALSGTSTSPLAAPLPQGLIVEDLEPGNGETATNGKHVVVHFEGFLENGSRFSSSKVSNDPLDFKLGEGKMIRGLEEGLKGMRTGGKRKLVIPAELAFKDHGLYGLVPPNEKVHYVVELLSVR